MISTPTKSLLAALLLSVSTSLFSQNIAINTSGNPGVTGTMLDLSNNLTTGTTAFLAPYVTLTSSTLLAPVTGAGPAGLLVYNISASTLNGLSGAGYYYWTGSQWNYVYSTGNVGNFIQNQAAAQQTANYWISGPASIGTANVASQQLTVVTPTAANIGIVGQNTAAAGAGTGIGVQGTSAQSNGAGVSGSNSNVAGIAVGVEGYLGALTNPTFPTGIYASVVAPNSGAYGMEGYLSGAGTSYGAAVYGNNSNTGANVQYGVQGSKLGNTATGTGYGVYGQATGTAASNTGGYFTASGGTLNHGINIGAGDIALNNSAGTAGQVLTSAGPNVLPTWTTPTTGTVTGSGTLNYVPKWTPSGTVLGNSQIFDNGTNVGIGTNTPSVVTKLTVTGDGNGYAQIGGGSGCGGNYTGISLNGLPFSACGNYNILSSPTDPNLYINRGSGYNMYFRENNGTQLFIQTGGLVGIGTTTPRTNLDINGALDVGTYGGITSVPTTYGSIGLSLGENGYYGVLFGQTTANPNLMYDGAGNGGVYYQNWGWLYYTTTSNHFTGIGTTAPSAPLDIQETSGPMANFGSTASCCAGGNPTISVSEATSSNNRLPWIQFHVSGYQEAFLRLNKDTRVFEMGDDQSVGVDLALLNGAGVRNVYISPRSTSYFNGGNVGIGTNAPAYKLAVTGNIFDVIPSQGNLGLTGDLPGYPVNTYPTLKCGGSYMYISVGGLYSAYVSSGGTWTVVSDRNKKENITQLNPQEILNKIDKLPITQWNYISEGDSIRHIGPMAQDFHALFGLNGSNDKMISTTDPSGVALAGVKALIEKVKEQQKTIDSLGTSLNRLNSQLSIQNTGTGQDNQTILTKLAAEDKEIAELKQLIYSLTKGETKTN